MIIRVIKYLVNKIDLLFGIIDPVLPKASDNFAFRDDSERQSYYDRTGTFADEPCEKFRLTKLFTLFLKGLLIFIGWWVFIVFSYYLINGWF